MWISLLTGNWKLIVAGIVIAGAFYKIDDRAYRSGLDKATRVCENETVPSAIEIERASCLQQITRLEKSNAQNIRSKDTANSRYFAALHELRSYKAGNKNPSSKLAESGTKGLPVPAEGGEDRDAAILELGRDAAIRDGEFNNCRAFVLGL